MKNLLRIMLEGAYGNFKKIFFHSECLTDMELRNDILTANVKTTDKVSKNACVGCGGCANVCPTGAVSMEKLETPEELIKGWIKDEVPKLNSEKCIFCYYCHDFCPIYALFGENATIHPNDVGNVDIKLGELMNVPFKISNDKLAFISQFLSDKTLLNNNTSAINNLNNNTDNNIDNNNNTDSNNNTDNNVDNNIDNNINDNYNNIPTNDLENSGDK
ncbi:NADH-quinone oxidoreductase subunit I [Methanobrevibacter curvatus]|uniref:NADH-quinone oxidoreductase subunit I n=1 Tax=Methanobrevibacter curvatus TaxID=49547 RepID=A0A166C566_9EURY|nr:4Fe-4S binding protein [Methanobrevibacter curvatus]KZX14140.1 NADH-quinone oxidoreductase subunit I [Methanobrevibacter curvatus]